MNATIAIRPFESRDDYRGMIRYFHSASDELLVRMGVDRGRLPAPDVWLQQAWADHELDEQDPTRERFHVAWLLDDELIGHSSINQLRWGELAYAHLHLWRRDLRRDGIGTELFRRSLSLYFERFDLRRIFVEPNAGNPAPNAVVRRLGFRFVKAHRTVPGPLNFEQDVNLWEMDRGRWGGEEG